VLLRADLPHDPVRRRDSALHPPIPSGRMLTRKENPAREIVVDSLRSVLSNRPSAADMHEERERLRAEVQDRIKVGDFSVIGRLQPRLSCEPTSRATTQWNAIRRVIDACSGTAISPTTVY
jgi:hypothetical protein